MLSSDVDPSAATTFGYNQGIVEAWMKAEGISRDLSLSKTPQKHAMIERLWRTMKESATASLGTAGLRSEWYYYAVDAWAFTSNHSTGSGSNHVGGQSQSPE